MPTPTPFGKYLLIEKVATGGMAEVWRARLKDAPGEILAVKRILPEIADEPNFVTMFLNEARVAVQLDHSGVVQIKDLGEIDGSYFLAMEFVAGQTLRKIIDRTRTQPWSSWQLPFSALVAQRVAEALDYVHRKKGVDGRSLGIVHRDVSPDNVIVSYDGQVKLVDFGVAKAAIGAAATGVGLIKGKLAYLSPEQSVGGLIDGRSDLFSLGAVLYELLTGARLFLGADELKTVEAVRERKIPAPSEMRPGVPPELDAIVLKALERDLSKRYANGGEMAAELEALLAKQPPYGPDELATLVRKNFPMEWEKEKVAAAELARARSTPPPAKPAARAPSPPPTLPEMALEPPGEHDFSEDATEMTNQRPGPSPITPPKPGALSKPVTPPGARSKPSPSIPTPAKPYMPQAAALMVTPQRRPWRWVALAALLVVAVAGWFVLPGLFADKGFLIVNASPAGATVTVDGEPEAERGVVHQLKAGPHEVLVEAPGFESFRQQVQVTPGAQKTVDAELVFGGK